MREERRDTGISEESSDEVGPRKTANALPVTFLWWFVELFLEVSYGLQRVEVGLDTFVSWLCSHEDDVVGVPGPCFDAPLARWLSEMTGYVFGLDGKWYGRASSEYGRWRLLSRWAEIFCAWTESRAYQPLTGREARDVVAQVELMLASMGVRQACSAAA